MEIETVCAADMLPVRAHEADAGADLKAARDVAIRRGDTAKVSTGVRVSIPEGCFGLLAARSSLCGRGLMMLNGVGIIDSGYTGEVQVPLANIGNRTQRVAAGERVAQLVIVPCELPTFRRVDKLEDTERGEGGFGSTGGGVMKDLRSGIEHLKQAKAHMSKANGIMSDHISKFKALEEENAELRDELDDWKGNAEGFQPDSYMKLPVDADGIAIRPGDKIYFNGDPEGFALKCIAVGWPPCPVEFVDWEETGTTAWEEGSAFTHRQPTSKLVDSWEKLEEDAKKTACNYALAPRDEDGLTTCNGCRFQESESCHHEMTLEILKRAKKLAGIEEAQ